MTPYSYDHEAIEDYSVLNIGWLSIDHPFPRGEAPQGFVQILSELAESPTNLFRGSHSCEFCPAREPLAAKKIGLQMIEDDPETMGNGEIRVKGENGITYVAPVLVRHYVTEHRYLPPQEFIDAVTTSKGPTVELG